MGRGTHPSHTQRGDGHSRYVSPVRLKSGGQTNNFSTPKKPQSARRKCGVLISNIGHWTFVCPLVCPNKGATRGLHTSKFACVATAKSYDWQFVCNPYSNKETFISIRSSRKHTNAAGRIHFCSRRKMVKKVLFRIGNRNPFGAGIANFNICGLASRKQLANCVEALILN